MIEKRYLCLLCEQKYFSLLRPGVMAIIGPNDFNQAMMGGSFIDLCADYKVMILSKSFGYALRGILYVALLKDENRKVPIDEIAGRLSVPRHFLGKIMKAVVKAGIISSTRGQQGGFFINEKTVGTPIITIILLTEGKNYFNTCLLSLRKCNAMNPCPMHNKVEKFKNELLDVYTRTTIGDLLKDDKPEFIKSIATKI